MFESGKFSAIIRKNRHTPIKMSKQEYAIFMHEVNTYYGKNEKRLTLFKCIGDRFYVFDYFGFNDYNVYKRLKIVGNEKRIKATMEALKDGQ